MCYYLSNIYTLSSKMILLKKIILLITVICSSFVWVYADGVGDWDITSTDFKINVSSLTPGDSSLVDTSAEGTITAVLKRVIERLIIGIGTIALFVMVLWAGQMILYAGEDERLTKWKTIFIWWLTAVAIALLSGLMVQLVAYLLYI